jgi:hypothetical protein
LDSRTEEEEMMPSVLRSFAELTDAERSAFFRKCIGRALLLQLPLFIATFLTSIAIQFVVTFVGLFFVDGVAQLDTAIRVLQWAALIPWTLAAFWWYTQWLLRTHFGSSFIVFLEQGAHPQPNNAQLG